MLDMSWLHPVTQMVPLSASALENLAGGSSLYLGQCNKKGTVKANFPEEEED